MQSDDELAMRALDLQARARDIPLPQIPSYQVWAKRKLAEGISEELIAHLDATAMWLLPEDIEAVCDDEFDEMLEDLIASLD